MGPYREFNGVNRGFLTGLPGSTGLWEGRSDKIQRSEVGKPLKTSRIVKLRDVTATEVRALVGFGAVGGGQTSAAFVRIAAGHGSAPWVT